MKRGFIVRVNFRCGSFSADHRAASWDFTHIKEAELSFFVYHLNWPLNHVTMETNQLLIGLNQTHVFPRRRGSPIQMRSFQLRSESHITESFDKKFTRQLVPINNISWSTDRLWLSRDDFYFVKNLRFKLWKQSFFLKNYILF